MTLSPVRGISTSYGISGGPGISPFPGISQWTGECAYPLSEDVSWIPGATPMVVSGAGFQTASYTTTAGGPVDAYAVPAGLATLNFTTGTRVIEWQSILMPAGAGGGTTAIAYLLDLFLTSAITPVGGVIVRLYVRKNGTRYVGVLTDSDGNGSYTVQYENAAASSFPSRIAIVADCTGGTVSVLLDGVAVTLTSATFTAGQYIAWEKAYQNSSLAAGDVGKVVGATLVTSAADMDGMYGWQHYDACGNAIAETADLFVIVGQSNAEGRGNSTLSPAAPHGLYISGGTITSPLADPVGGANTGSMWPAFSNEWYAQTGRRSAFVESATGGTALLPDTAGANWSPSGTLRGTAVSSANAAIAAVQAAGYMLGSVYFVWAQGEQDAATINGTTVTGPLYEQALEELAAYFKAQVPQVVTMGVVQTGGNFNLVSMAEYAAIRLAQENACADSANLTMLYRGAYSFIARNYMADEVHYNQSGLNVAGKCASRALATGVAAIPVAPAVLAATAYPDPSYTASTTRADNHTTASGTKMIVVAMSAMRPESNNTFFVDSVKFGGVSLKLLRDEKAGVNASPAGRVNSAIWYLTETDYGASLSGVTAEILVSDTTSMSIYDWCVIDCDAEGIPEAYNGVGTVSTTTDNGSVLLSTSAPSLVVGIGSSAASAAATLTATLTNVTEAMDHGLANGGATRTGQMVAGYSAESAIVTNKTYTATWSATCTSLSWVVGAFRGKISGE